MATKEQNEKYGELAVFLDDTYDPVISEVRRIFSPPELIIDNAKAVKSALYQSGKILGYYGQILDFDFIISLLNSIVGAAEDIIEADEEETFSKHLAASFDKIDLEHKLNEK